MRVVDTPITELGFAGIGVGAAMVGLRPIIEFMTWNFALLAIDQVVNAAAKMLYDVRRAVQHPDRVPRPERRGAAALRAALAGVGVVARARSRAQGRRAGTPADAKGLLKSAIRDDNPVVFLEGEMLYNMKGEVPDGRVHDSARQGRGEARGRATSRSSRTARWSTSRIRRPTSSRRKASRRGRRSAHAAAARRETIVASVKKTNRAVVVEEGWEICGVGAQVVDYVQRDCFDDLDAPVLRVHQADVPMPYAKNLERAAKPDAQKTVAAVRQVLYLD